MSFNSDTICHCSVREAANFGERKDGATVEILLLHYTGMKTAEAAINWLCIEESNVSCHYLVDEDGTILQMVPEKYRAWHAGKSCWRDVTDINSCSIGIEIVNPGHEHGYSEFPDKQIESLIELCRDIVARHDLRPENVLAHSDVAPARKVDPGEKFPWERLHAKGVGIWASAPEVSNVARWQLGDNGEPVAAMQAMLALHGYCIEISGNFDEHTERVVAAFQRHFRQGKVDGIADGETLAILDMLVNSG